MGDLRLGCGAGGQADQRRRLTVLHLGVHVWPFFISAATQPKTKFLFRASISPVTQNIYSLLWEAVQWEPSPGQRS